MSQLQKLFVFSLFCSFIFVLNAHTHNCIHDKLNFERQYIELSDFDEHSDGRMLAVTWNNIRVHFDFSMISSLSTSDQNYIKYSIIGPTKNYFEQTLKVIPMTSNIKISSSTICDEAVVPASYKTTGVAADLVVFVKTSNEPDQSYIAYASSCIYHPTTGRPVAGLINFNMYYVKTSGSAADTESNVGTTLHELTHVLAFSDNLYDTFIDPNTNAKLTGHVIQRTVNGVGATLLNLPTLTSKLRAHYNCSTLEGALLENQGDSGSAGSHWERRVFFNEYMTASAIYDSRVTAFTLALLEGSGWYQVDYSMAEPVTWGKNEGCGFIYSSCVDKTTKTANFQEFCTTLNAKGCSWTGRGGSACGPKTGVDSSLSAALNYWGNNTVVADSFADNCPIFNVYDNLDCANPANQGGSTLSDKEFYGEGSQCFMGTLFYTGALANAYPYCFVSKCVAQSDGSYKVKVTVDGADYDCPSDTQISITGLKGKLNCPNTAKFCYQKVNEGYCERKCTGRGSCKNKVCVCNDGWTGSDCSIPTYTDSCAKCATSTPKTSCYGDVCACPTSGPTSSSCISTFGSPAGPIDFTVHNGGQNNVNNDADTTASVPPGTDGGTSGGTSNSTSTDYNSSNNKSTSSSSEDGLEKILGGAIGGGGSLAILAGLILGCKHVQQQRRNKQAQRQAAYGEGAKIPAEMRFEARTPGTAFPAEYNDSARQLNRA